MTDDAAPAPHASAEVAPTRPAPESSASSVDLEAIERDLDAVESALTRLADGTYRMDEVTGAPLPDELLDRDPLARRA